MPIEAAEEAIRLFGEVVAVDPLSAGLFLVGNALLLGSIAVFGLLSVWGVIAALRPA